VACANVDGKYYAIQGACPRCAFDLWKGTLISDDPAFDDLPRIACPTCATTFSLKSGQRGPAIKRSGMQGFVTGLAKQATTENDTKSAKAYRITVDDEEGKVYCRM
jgi:nitrite reductase/ring-hydroxylating ferredoxin subunit